MQTKQLWMFALFLVSAGLIAALPSTSARCLLNTSCDFGGATTTQFIFTTDGTGTTEVVLPGQSVSTGEIANGTIGAGNMAATFTFTSTANDMGWAVVAGANVACTTTCTSACLFGVNTAATEADIVNCADATADECLCAGAT